MSNLPAGAEQDPSNPENEVRKECSFCNQELILSEGTWIHQFGGKDNKCPAFCDECGTLLMIGNYCPECDAVIF